MKILHVYKTFLSETFGGVEQTIYQIAKTTSAQFNHSVLSLTKERTAATSLHEGICTIRYKENFSLASNSFSLSLMRDFKRLVARADVIHYHFPWPFADLLHVGWRIKKPSVVTYHSDIVRQQQLLYFYRPLMHRFLSKQNRIIATSPNYAASSPILQRYKDKVSVIPIGLDKKSYPKTADECLQRWRQQFPGRFFLFVGVMRYYKGLHILLQALAGTDFPVVIIGSGPMEEELKREAQRLGLTRVYFAGPLPDEDKMALLELCYAVVFPSHLRSEAFGITLLEGAMAGKPLISAEIGTGTSYINRDKVTGLIVPPADPQGLQHAMRYLWEHPEEAARMGEHASVRYYELFTQEQMCTAYEKIYLEVVAESLQT
ncbi:MAG: glycosyl transferase family 1 [Legionella sp. 40-6]|nr:glycosyltransferase [Legionella sp.]OJY09426.1 MAG: glycosyl transferase family 1 [Legionella sp. 40-6]